MKCLVTGGAGFIASHVVYRYIADGHDVVVVDEFHHAAARSYRALLDHVSPRELLGLTATPERADGLTILDWFEGAISAELRLWDAIDQGRLVPFEYYGLHDGVDLREIPWKRGRGYDVEALSNLYTGNDVWARLVLDQLATHSSPLCQLTLGETGGFSVAAQTRHARNLALLLAI